MPIEVGDTIPNVNLYRIGESGGPEAFPAHEFFRGKKVALFASCGGSAGSTSDDLTKLLPGAEVAGQSIYAWGKGAVAEELLRSACDWAREVVSS